MRQGQRTNRCRKSEARNFALLILTSPGGNGLLADITGSNLHDLKTDDFVEEQGTAMIRLAFLIAGLILRLQFSDWAGALSG